jgi:hypothetical protein
VYETTPTYFSQNDLTQFQKTYNLTLQAAIDVGQKPITSCTFSSCLEGNLDLQYIMGLAQKSPTAYWWTNGTASTVTADSFVDFLYSVPSNYTTLSISWGAEEQVIFS